MLTDTTTINSTNNFLTSMVLIGYLFFHDSTVSCRPRHIHCRGFTIMLRHNTLSRTPLDEWSARRRDLYPITYNTLKRQTSMPRAEFEPTISAGEWPQIQALDRAAAGIDFWLVTIVPKYWNLPSSQRIYTRNGDVFLHATGKVRTHMLFSLSFYIYLLSNI
jgi:hypothetical protein